MIELAAKAMLKSIAFHAAVNTNRQTQMTGEIGLFQILVLIESVAIFLLEPVWLEALGEDRVGYDGHIGPHGVQQGIGYRELEIACRSLVFRDDAICFLDRRDGTHLFSSSDCQI